MQIELLCNRGAGRGLLHLASVPSRLYGFDRQQLCRVAMDERTLKGSERLVGDGYLSGRFWPRHRTVAVSSNRVDAVKHDITRLRTSVENFSGA